MTREKAVDGRHKPGHDGRGDSNRATIGLESGAEESGDRHVKSHLDRYECARTKVLLDALASLRRTDSGNVRQIDALTVKLIHSPPHPAITVGVHGGQVQWTLGNPFPIRVCDYDGDREDLPDLDERGQHCRIWLEPASNAKSI